MPAAQALRIEGDIPVSLAVRNGKKFLFISRDQRALTHGIHKYPAKFFPELPRWIIERYSQKGDVILDPFTGSGTSNLEASLLGRDSVGVDVDLFSRFITKVKTRPLPERELLRVYKLIRKAVEGYREPLHLEGVPEFPYRDKWFKPYILKELAYLKRYIERVKTIREIKNFFLVCFSSVIRQVSEADNNCTRTVIRKKLGKEVKPGAALSLFLRRTAKQVENMNILSAMKPSGDVLIPENADARDMSVLKDSSIDLALTSPPYLNAVDYPRTHQLEIYWLGFASGSLQPLKSQHVGTEVVRAEEYAELHKTGSSEADRAVRKIYKLDRRRAYIATKYVRDMFCNLREVYRILKPGAAYVIVVGNNLVRELSLRLGVIYERKHQKSATKWNAILFLQS